MELFQILECFLPEIFNELVLVLAKKSIQNFPLHCVEESELTFWPVVGLKLNIQKMKIMASGPITSWEIDGETVETVSDFILGKLQNHPTPVLLPGKSHGQRSLVGYSPWGR